MANQPFKHPADAMQAKIEGKLACGYCQHMHIDPDWCDKHDTRPETEGGRSALYHGFCPNFQFDPTWWTDRGE